MSSSSKKNSQIFLIMSLTHFNPHFFQASVNALVQENGAGSSLVTTANLLAASQGNIAPTFTQEQTTGLLEAARAEGLEEVPFMKHSHFLIFVYICC